MKLRAAAFIGVFVSILLADAAFTQPASADGGLLGGLLNGQQSEQPATPPEPSDNQSEDANQSLGRAAGDLVTGTLGAVDEVLSPQSQSSATGQPSDPTAADPNEPSTPATSSSPATTLEKTLNQAAQPLASTLEPALQAVEPVLQAVEPVAQTAEPLIDAVQPAIEAAVEPVVQATAPVLETVVEPVVQAAAPVLETLVEPVVQAVAPVIETVVEPVAQAAAPVIDTVIPPVVDAVVPPVVDTVPPPVVDAVVPPVVDTVPPPVVDAVVPPDAGGALAAVIETAPGAQVVLGGGAAVYADPPVRKTASPADVFPRGVSPVLLPGLPMMRPDTPAILADLNGFGPLGNVGTTHVPAFGSLDARPAGLPEQLEALAGASAATTRTLTPRADSGAHFDPLAFVPGSGSLTVPGGGSSAFAGILTSFLLLALALFASKRVDLDGLRLPTHAYAPLLPPG